MICLHDLSGLWRRTSIGWPDGRTDTETEVFWLQGPRHYADLRIPAGRSASPYATCLRDLEPAMLRFMARQEGFFGRFDIVDSIGRWQRRFNYQPDTGVADRGALAFEDGILVERGIELPYVEHWSRQSAGGDAMALVLATETGMPGCLVTAGDAFIYARGRATTLPQGATLSGLIDGAASLQAAQDIFDCEISFGRRHAGDWRIERSSHCFREGATLSPTLGGVTGSLIVDDVTPEGAPIKRAWRVAEHESTRGASLSVWFRPNGGEDMPRPQDRMQNRTTETFETVR